MKSTGFLFLQCRRCHAMARNGNSNDAHHKLKKKTQKNHSTVDRLSQCVQIAWNFFFHISNGFNLVNCPIRVAPITNEIYWLLWLTARFVPPYSFDGLTFAIRMGKMIDHDWTHTPLLRCRLKKKVAKNLEQTKTWKSRSTHITHRVTAVNNANQIMQLTKRILKRLAHVKFLDVWISRTVAKQKKTAIKRNEEWNERHDWLTN